MTATPILVSARRDNPLCGDTIDLSVGIVQGLVRPAWHQAHACSLVITSAALLSRVVAGMTVADALALADRIERAVRGLEALPDDCEAIRRCSCSLRGAAARSCRGRRCGTR